MVDFLMFMFILWICRVIRCIIQQIQINPKHPGTRKWLIIVIWQQFPIWNHTPFTRCVFRLTPQWAPVRCPPQCKWKPNKVTLTTTIKQHVIFSSLLIYSILRMKPTSFSFSSRFFEARKALNKTQTFKPSTTSYSFLNTHFHPLLIYWSLFKWNRKLLIFNMESFTHIWVSLNKKMLDNNIKRCWEGCCEIAEK